MILFVAEHANGKLSKSAYELATAARGLGRGDVAALVLGSGVANVASAAALIADQVLVGDSAELAQYDAEVWSAAVAQIATEGEAEVVLIAGSRSGREYSPRVAVKLDAPLLEDVTSLKDEGGVLHAEHYTFLTRVTERVEAKAAVVVVSVKAGAFAPAAAGTAAAEQFDVDLTVAEAAAGGYGKQQGEDGAHCVGRGGHRGFGWARSWNAGGICGAGGGVGGSVGSCGGSYAGGGGCGVAALLGTGGADGEDGAAEGLYCCWDLGGGAASVRDEQEQGDCGDQ